jgi:ribonuclease Z
MSPFELTILGCGSATPTNKRNPSAQLLHVAGRYFLIDCGEGTQVQLRRFKCNFSRIDHIFISHMHGDHYFGLIGLLQSFHLLGRRKKMVVYGPAALKEAIEVQNKVSETRLVYPLEFVAVNPKVPQVIFDDEKVSVTTIPLDHRIACTGFLFREKNFLRKIIKEKLTEAKIPVSEMNRLKQGFDVTDEDGNLVKNSELTLDPAPPRSYAYCSDTRFNEKLAAQLQGVDLLYHESTFLEDMKDRAVMTMHSTAKEAAQMAVLAGAKKLILGHFSSRYDDETLFLEEASTVFPGSLLASEGKIFQP